MNIKQSLALTSAAFAGILLPFTASASFEEVSPYIDIDGSMVGYMDFEGDGQEIGTALNTIYEHLLASKLGMSPIPVDFNLLIENLGFGSLKAVGMSSKDAGEELHLNRWVSLMDGAPKGLFAIYELEPLSFDAAKMAPADATGAMTLTVNLGALRETTIQILKQIMGPMGEAIIQQKLGKLIPATDITLNEGIDILSGRWDGFWHLSYSEDFQEDFKLWLSIEGAGSLLPRLHMIGKSMGVNFIEDDQGIKADFSSLMGENATNGLYVEAPKEGDSLIIYTHQDWTPESGGARLADSDEFKNLASRLPAEGIAFSYSKGADLEPMFATIAAFPGAAQYTELAKSAIDFLVGDFLKPNLAISYMDGDHMVSEQYASYSTKQILMAIPAIAGGGIGAAIAIPAFQKIRETSQ
jgi:hypothetical protein